MDTLARIDTESIQARHRIEDVITASGVELQQVGRQLMGRCPFHDDHTASLSVGGVADRYHCFGCGAGGDVIDYVGRLHGVGFRRAIEILDGQQIQPTISQSFEPAPQEQSMADIAVERAWEINAMAWAYYTQPVHHEFALAHTRHRRGLDLAPAEAGLGHPLLGRAGNGWTSLTQHLRNHGVTDAELIGLDLAVVGRHGLVDTYRERLVAPITDDHGHITGLVGRDLSGRPRAPKYRNPTRTVVFDKSTTLYTPRQTIPEGAQVLIVEGPFDALAVTAASIATDRNVTAVATCGTTVTPAQAATVLEHHPSQVIIALDGDAAGHAGTGRWVEQVCRQGRHSVNVTDLPAGLDPAELIGRYGLGVLDVIIEQARPVRPEHAPSTIRAGRDPARSFDPPLAFAPRCFPERSAPTSSTTSRPL